MLPINQKHLKINPYKTRIPKSKKIKLKNKKKMQRQKMQKKNK